MVHMPNNYVVMEQKELQIKGTKHLMMKYQIICVKNSLL